MQKSRKIYLFVSLLVIVSVMLVAETSFSTVTTTQKFSDVTESDWFFSDVQYVYEKGFMNGTGDTTFSPCNPTTRAMIATVLWRTEGFPDGGNVMFEDVRTDAYYREAVAWCAEKNIVYGYNSAVFGSDDYITREQLVTMLYRYADYKGYDITGGKSLSEYSDAGDISEFAHTQFEWAIASGIVAGTSADTLSPREKANRAQVAAILKRFYEKFQESSVAEKGNQTENKEQSKSSGSGSFGNYGGYAQVDKSESESDGEEADTTPLENFPVISGDNVIAKPGETVQFAINIKNNPGILGMVLSAHFNEEALSLQSAEKGDALSVLEFTSSKTLESGVRFVWDGVEIKPEDVKSGTVVLMNFVIKEDAKDGKYPISIKYADGDIVDNDLKTVTPSVEDGYITVLKGGDI